MAFAVAMLLYQFSLSRQVNNLQSQKADLASQIKTPDNQKLEALINGTADSIALIKSLQNSAEYKMGNFIVDFPKLVGTGVVIKNLSVDADLQVKVDAATASQASLAKFMQSLQDSPLFQDVTLVSSGTGGAAPKTATTFSIVAKINKAAANEGLLKKTQASAPVTTNPTSVPATQ